MIFEQHYLDCLSQASYLVGDEGSHKAVVVDPRRDIGVYLESAADQDLEIVAVAVTHFHADFLSGHLELAAATGAEIWLGPGAEPEFEARILADGEKIPLGEVVLEILHTPGHTPESFSIVVWESPSASAPYGVLTGDTLFIGDVGRPDLQSSLGYTADDLGHQLFHSLKDKILPLPDETRVFPGHGAGSSCGKNMSTDTWSTLGEQRRTNYALQFDVAEDFVAAVTDGLRAAPAYFGYDAMLNRQTHRLFDEGERPPAMSFDDLIESQAQGAFVLDTRDADAFAEGHLFRSINVGLEGRYAEFAGGVIDPGHAMILITEPGYETEAAIRLARIGFDYVIGFLDDYKAVFEAHPELVVQTRRLSVAGLAQAQAASSDLVLLDVRNPAEVEQGMIPGAVHIPLPHLNSLIDELDPSRPTVVYCAGGYRSSIAVSRLCRAGFRKIVELHGGYDKWVETAGRADDPHLKKKREPATP